MDFLSLYRLRTDLDRARVLFDCILRREKVPRCGLFLCLLDCLLDPKDGGHTRRGGGVDGAERRRGGGRGEGLLSG